MKVGTLVGSPEPSEPFDYVQAAKEYRDNYRNMLSMAYRAVVRSSSLSGAIRRQTRA
jgi:hypothetical protein